MGKPLSKSTALITITMLQSHLTTFTLLAFLSESFFHDEEGMQACNCLRPCMETEYTSKISTYKYPSQLDSRLKNYTRGNSVQGGIQTNDIDTFVPVKAHQKNFSLLVFLEMIKYTEKSHILLRIYFGKMSYQKLEEKVAYSVFDMIGSVDLASDTNATVCICEPKFSLNLQPAWEERWVSALERVYSRSVSSLSTAYWHWYMASDAAKNKETKPKLLL